jgi:NADPH-ferrihemoprotein reductase
MRASSTELVRQLAARVGVALDQEFTLHADSSIGTLETPFPCPTTVSHALTHYLDINGSVSKTLLRRLGQLATDDGERAKLLQVRRLLSAAPATRPLSRHAVVVETQRWFCRPVRRGGARRCAAVHDIHEQRLTSHARAQVQRERLNILDILNRFKSVNVSAAQLFELLPRLQVRYYSIASSDKIHPTTVAIVAVVDRDTMPSGKVIATPAVVCGALVSVLLLNSVLMRLL